MNSNNLNQDNEFYIDQEHVNKKTDQEQKPVSRFNWDDQDDTEVMINNNEDFDWGEDSKNTPLSKDRPLSTDEYIDLVESYNEGAENKNYVFIFGLGGSGKSHMIASILDYMQRCDLGVSRLDNEASSQQEINRYNQMLMMLERQDDVPRNPFNEFHKLNVVFTPTEQSLPEAKVTFLDISGEACQQAFNYARGAHAALYTGELPDFLTAVLESDINCTFIFVYDPKSKQDEKFKTKGQPSQEIILNSFYDQILGLQDKKGKKFRKLLLISKWDELSISQSYDGDVHEYVKDKLPVMSAKFENERVDGRPLNAITYYSIGKFIRGKLSEPNHDRSKAVFSWIYESITNRSIKPKKDPWVTFKNYLMGK